jgi:hypothetical protein
MGRIYFLAIALAGIMMSACFPVNAWAATTPSFNQVTPNDKSAIDQLVIYLLKHGDESPIKEHLAPVLGLPGPTSGKSAIIIKEEHPAEHGFDSFARLCILAYENSSDAAQVDKRPLCVFLRKHVVSGFDDDDTFFRINLDGHLEKIIAIHGKRDADGKAVHGSGVPSEQDIESSESKKSFAVEMAAMKKWLKAQKNILAKADATKPSATSATTP